jgi:hypothetical protein
MEATAGTLPLSPFARDVITAGAYDRLVVDGRTPDDARHLLADVSPDRLLAVPLASVGHGYAMLCGLWLWHDALHECHEIAQADVESLHRAMLVLRRRQSERPRAGQPVQPMQPVRPVELDRAGFGREVAVATPSFNYWHAGMQWA